MKPTLIIALMIVLPISVNAQESESEVTPTVQESAAPATMVGQSAGHGLLGDLQTPNYLKGGISVSQLFSDNAGLASTDRVNDVSYGIQSNLTLGHFTPRLSYDVGVVGGVVLSRKLSDRNQATESAVADLSYGLSQFVTLRLSDGFTNSTGLWSGATGGGNLSIGPGIGVVQQGNTSPFTYGSFRTNNALAELSAQLNASSSAGVRATHLYTWFPSGANDPLVGTLYGGSVYSAETYYNHQFTLRNFGGISLRGQLFDMDRTVGRTDTVSLLFMYGYNFRPNLSLSFFGGPELSTTDAPQGIPAPVLPFPRRMWSPAAGTVFSVKGLKTGGSASYTHQISGGGGLLSAVTLDSVDAEVFRRYGRRFQLGPGFTYFLNTPIVPSPTLRTYSGRLQATYQIGNIALSGAYSRDNRTIVGSNASASADNVWLSFTYGFLKPLGR
jgi:hypothetical protein